MFVRRLRAFEARLRVRDRKHPKLYWIDPGVARTVKGARGPVAAEEVGSLFEGWVHTLLCTYVAERGLAEDVSYWAPSESGTEVDFVLRRGFSFCAIEVNASRRVDNAQLAGLRAIGELRGVERRILLYRGDRPMRTDDGIDVLPVIAFCDALAHGTLWP